MQNNLNSRRLAQEGLELLTAYPDQARKKFEEALSLDPDCSLARSILKQMGWSYEDGNGKEIVATNEKEKVVEHRKKRRKSCKARAGSEDVDLSTYFEGDRKLCLGLLGKRKTFKNKRDVRVMAHLLVNIEIRRKKIKGVDHKLSEDEAKAIFKRYKASSPRIEEAYEIYLDTRKAHGEVVTPCMELKRLGFCGYENNPLQCPIYQEAKKKWKVIPYAHFNPNWLVSSGNAWLMTKDDFWFYCVGMERLEASFYGKASNRKGKECWIYMKVSSIAKFCGMSRVTLGEKIIPNLKKYGFIDWKLDEKRKADEKRIVVAIRRIIPINPITQEKIDLFLGKPTNLQNEEIPF